MIPWITEVELVKGARQLAVMLPPDIDALVGISRSGMIVAPLLASSLHVPLYCASEDKGVFCCGGGWRATRLDPTPPKRVLLVDDTSCTGRSMEKLLPWVRVAFIGAAVETAVVYATPETAADLTYMAKELPQPHYLEWNFFNSGFINSSAFDMDGILCEDVPLESDDDGEAYAECLRTIRPKYMPRRQPIPAILTGRLEKYRKLTTDWLIAHGIAAVRLIMWPWTFQDRARPGALVRWKAEQYGRMALPLLIESDPRQAEPIAAIAGKSVLCPEAGKVFGS